MPNNKEKQEQTMDVEMVYMWQKEIHVFVSIPHLQVHYNKTIPLSSLEHSPINNSYQDYYQVLSLNYFYNSEKFYSPTN